MHDIRFARKPPHPLVGLSGEVEGLDDDICFLSMARGKIGIEEMLESISDHFIISLFSFDVFYILVIHKILLFLI